MTAQPQFWLGDDSAQVTAAINVLQVGGTIYGPVTYHLWNDKGGSLGATTLKNCRIRPTVYNGSGRSSSGYPILDEAWTQVAIVGFSNVGDSTFQPSTTGYKPLGTSSQIIFPDIPANCSLYVSIKINVPAGVSSATQEIFYELLFDESSLPLARAMGIAIGPGVIPDFRDKSIRRMRRGATITASGTADVVVSKRAFSYDGVPYNVLKVTKTLNQTANDGALAAGQSYYARFSQKSDTTVTVTKGNKGTSPVAPNVPTDEINLGKVRVLYQAGGTSIINTADVDQTEVLYGEYLVTTRTGLTVNVGAGNAVSSNDVLMFSGANAVVAVPDNTAAYYIFLLPDGTLSGNTTGFAPVVGAVELAVVQTSGGVVTVIQDLRNWSDQSTARTVIMSFMGTLAVASDVGVACLPGVSHSSDSGAANGYYIEAVDVVVRVAGSGSGSTKIDVKLWSGGVGTTLYTSSGTDDQRPTISTAGLASGKALDHEINSVTGMAPFAFDIVSVPTTPPEDIFVTLYLRSRGNNQ